MLAKKCDILNENEEVQNNGSCQKDKAGYKVSYCSWIVMTIKY